MLVASDAVASENGNENDNASDSDNDEGDNDEDDDGTLPVHGRSQYRRMLICKRSQTCKGHANSNVWMRPYDQTSNNMQGLR